MERLSVFIVLCACLGYTLAAQWSYVGDTGVDNWAEKFPQECNGNSQSPVDIKEGDVEKSEALLNDPFQYSNYDTTTGITQTMKNNGHTVVVAVSGSTPVEVSGGGLGATYRVAQYHFHWGSSSAQGSEHLVNNHAYPMELHIVHYNTKYADLGTAVTKSDGLAVLGFMFEIQDADNQAYAEIVGKLVEVQAYDNSTVLTPFTLNSILPPTLSTSGFYRYSGGLTTPTCNEVVTWTVMVESIKISEAQMEEFRTILDSHNKPIVDNYRPAQPLNSRQVTTNFQPDLHWGYVTKVAPPQWEDYYGACGGNSQSPIDIPKYEAKTNDHMGDWTFSNYDTTSGVVMDISNNGHAVKVGIVQGVMTVQGGGLPQDTVYKVLQFHMHWGSSADMGSEHLIGGKAYPMELHIVHYNQAMDVNTAVKTPMGLAVLGFMFEESETDNPAYDSIVAALADIQNPKEKVSLAAMTLDSLIPAKEDLNHFYRYDGSLTTPGCFESVKWTVFTKTIPISRAQLNAFRSLLSAEKDPQNNTEHLRLVNNFRPVQPLNNRVVTVAVPAWTYDGVYGTASWEKYHPWCDDGPATRQSPINIDPETVTLDQSMGNFKFQGWNSPATMMLKNNGHSVVATVPSPGVLTMGGGLGDTYELAQFHFHWGSDSSKGSEHLIDLEAYPMEVHFVHYNTKYGSLGDAVTKSDGLAVLGVMFEIGGSDNPNMEPIVSKLSNVVDPDASAEMSAFAPATLLPSDLSDYYRYPGSLTTPGCFQSVTWTVFRESITLSEKQMAMFRTLKYHEVNAEGEHPPMVNNYRPVQNRNGRVIKATFQVGGAESSAPHCLVTLVTCVLVALLHRAV